MKNKNSKKETYKKIGIGAAIVVVLAIIILLLLRSCGGPVDEPGGIEFDPSATAGGWDEADLDAIRELGGGWVAEETVAIALYCALRHADSFEDAVIAAVNHDGDSDSTGAVTGNIMGALLGMEGIPAAFVQPLELRDVLLATAKKLAE